MSSHCVVVGAGIAGLTAAFELHRAGKPVTLLEADTEPGGHIKTVAMEGFLMETGPHSFMSAAETVFDLMELLGLEADLLPAADATRNRFILRNGGLHALPMSPGTFLTTRLLSMRGKLRLCMEPLMPRGKDPEESAWQFFCRRFGVEAATYMMSPFVSGIYAGDVKKLGAEAAFGKFRGFEQQTGSMILGAMRYMKAKRRRLQAQGKPVRKGLFSFKQGLGRLTSALGQALGSSFKPGCEVHAIADEKGYWVVQTRGHGSFSADSLVLAVPPHQASRLLAPVQERAAQILSQIELAPVAVVHWAMPEGDGELPRGFGFLVPRHYQNHVLGSIFVSDVFPGRAPAGMRSFATFFGGVTEPETVGSDDQTLFEWTRKEHAALAAGPYDQARCLQVRRYEHAIPQLTPGHQTRVEELESVLPAGMWLAGNYLQGVGIEQAAASGRDAAKRVLHRMAIDLN